MHGFPALEALPVVFASGANLIWESEAIRPPELLRAPPTVPDELERSRFGCRLDSNRSNEVGAARSATQCDTLDGELWL